MTLREKIQSILATRSVDLGRCVKNKIDINHDESTVSIHLEDEELLDDYVNFALLSSFSELLGTKAINLENEGHYPGCETCDHGARSEVTIMCRECEIN